MNLISVARRTIATTLFALTPMLLIGCQASETKIDVMDAKNEEVSYKLTSSENKDCSEGVRQLRNDQYDKAIASFDKAIADDATDWKAWFAKGIACEKKGDLDKALTCYETANSIPKKTIKEVDDSRLRVIEKKGGKGAAKS